MRAITIIRTELPCQTRPVEANCYLSHFCRLPILRREPPSRDDSPFARWRPRADQQRNRPKPRSSSAASTRMSRGRSTSSASATAHLPRSRRPLRSRCRPTTSARASNRSAPAVTTRRSRPSRVRAPMTPAYESGRATGRWRVQPQRRGQALSDPRTNRRPRGEIARVELRVTGYQMQLRSRRNAAEDGHLRAESVVTAERKYLYNGRMRIDRAAPRRERCACRADRAQRSPRRYGN